MDRFRQGNDSFPQVDLLNENLRVTFDITAEAFRYLPRISQADRRTGRERYRYLLGTVGRIARGAHISIRAVGMDEAAEKMLYGTYWEGIEEVDLNPTVIRDRANTLRRIYPEFRGMRFIGDVHTHPNSVAYPSPQDLASVVECYDSGIFKPHDPYIFGISAIRSDSEEEINFYRIVRTNSSSGYGFKLLEYPDD